MNRDAGFVMKRERMFKLKSTSMLKYLFIILSLLCIFSECKEGKPKENEVIENDNSCIKNGMVLSNIEDFKV